MVSLKDIAARCGVSVATVSKALSGQPDIGDQTRELIRRTADEMGYMANSAARALKTRRSFNLGVLFADEQNCGLKHAFFSALLDAIKVEAEKNGYDITFINKNVGSRNTTYLQHCLYRGVDGVIIACVDFKDPQVVELANSSFPVVAVDEIYENCPAVLSDNGEGIKTLVEYAYSMGHRKIAYIFGEPCLVTDTRVAAFRKTIADLGLRIPEEYIVEGIYQHPESCYERAKKMLLLAESPTCILCPDDYAYIGALNAATELGIKVPEELSLIGYDGIPLSQIVSPRLTTYRQDTDAIGKYATDMLIKLIEDQKTDSPERLTVTGEFLEGETVKKCDMRQ